MSFRTLPPLLLALALAAPPAAAAPSRVVSLNLCADQLLVLLAGRDRIAALSRLATSELSHVAGQAAGLPTTQGMAEEILPLAPDLVLTGRFSARPTVALLRAKGIPVLELSIPRDFEEIRRQVRQVAAALGAEARAESLLSAMDRTLAENAPPPAARRPVALAWQAGGFTAGAGTLTDAVLSAAGFENLAARNGLKGFGYVTLEAVIAGRPDLLIAESVLPGQPSLRQALLQHPALRHPGAVGARATIPAALLACGAPFTAEAVPLLRAALPR